MKKKQIFIVGISMAVLAAIVLVVIFILPGLKEEPEITIPLKIYLDLEFESEDDVKWLNALKYDGEWLNHPKDSLRDGYLHMGSETGLAFFNVAYGVEPNRFVHVRTRSGGGVCSSLALQYGEQDWDKGIELATCVDSLFNSHATHNRDFFGDSVNCEIFMSGSVASFEGEWVDRIMWINETGDQLFLVAANSNDPSFITYGSIMLPEDWQYNRWNPKIDAYFDDPSDLSNYMDVDFIRTGSGMLKDYLAENIPAYTENKDEMDAFLDSPAREMPPLLPFTQDGGEGEENNHDEESSFEQSNAPMEVQPTWDGVLTWPDPEPIIPYLVAKEDLAYCPTCEHTVYGVILNPFGYVFSASYGDQPENTPANVKPCVEEWVQLFDRPMTKAELFYLYRLQNARIKTNGSNEPFQVLYNGSETNLMQLKSNVLINSSAENTRNNYSTGLEIIDLISSQIPEDGLALPDLVDAPLTELNEELANEVLEAAWLAYSESPTTPVFELNDRVSFYFQLKKPVEKIESAVYHPDSQTYLSYYWMDNPGEDEMLPIAGCLAKGQAQNVNSYYFRDGQDTYLIRIWADGELVSEFEVEG